MGLIRRTTRSCLGTGFACAAGHRIAGNMPATRYRHGLGIVLALAVLSTVGAVGLSPIAPCGQEAGLIQFDVISELNLDLLQSGNMVVFARYWVCADYYVVSVVWTEPRGGGRDLKTVIVSSDEDSFRIENAYYSYWIPTNTSYPKPVGERPPFHWGGGTYGIEGMRFAEAQALARRVYVDDLTPAKGRDGTVQVDTSGRPDGIQRKLAHLTVEANNDRVESMELFDDQRRSLAKVRYEYESGTGPARLARLVAELPVRPQKLGIDTRIKIEGDAQKNVHRITEADHVYHKGGRTCTVTYKDVAVGRNVLRLPAQITVQRSDNKRLVRSARLMNFKSVDLDRDGVHKAAKAFGELDPEHAVWARLADRLTAKPRLVPLEIDPNDPVVSNRLIAKYPVPEDPPAARAPRPTLEDRGRSEPSLSEIDSSEEFQVWRREKIKRIAKDQERLTDRRHQAVRMPKPPRKDIEPNDVRTIRHLCAHYRKTLTLLTEEERNLQRTTGRSRGPRKIPESKLEGMELRDKLKGILSYHRVPSLPEDRQQDPNEADLELIRHLQGYYENRAREQARGIGGQLRALYWLMRMDVMVRDFEALEGHVTRYLRMLEDARLNEMYMLGGCCHIETFVVSARYERADRLLRPWAAKSAAINTCEGIYRFCRSRKGGKVYPWFSVKVLDEFLKRTNLSPVKRYEGLALRAIGLDKIDKLLADPKTTEDSSLEAQAQWILGSTTRAEVSRRVKATVLEAVAAWEALGPDRLTVAKPYSTISMAHEQKNMYELPDATWLQETSAQLNRIVQQRFPQAAGRSRPGPAGRPQLRR